MDKALKILLEDVKYDSLKVQLNKDFENSNGIIFLYCSWSPTLGLLKGMLKSLIKYPTIELFVFDIDNPKYLKVQSDFNLRSNAWGEIFWIVNNSIKFQMLKPSIVENLIKVDEYNRKLYDLIKSMRIKLMGFMFHNFD